MNLLLKKNDNFMLSIQNLKKHFDGVVVLNNFSISINSGEIIGLIGPNGAGKTTLFNIMTGYIPLESGTITFKDKELLGLKPHLISQFGVARTFQDLRLIGRLTVLENILLAFKNQAGESFWGQFFKSGTVKTQEKANRNRAISLLEYMGIPDKADDLADNLSYGQQKLLSLACCLAADAELILLDEPVAGINPDTINKILTVISDQKTAGKTVILIEHNLEVIKAVSDKIVVMDEGKKIAGGSYDDIKRDPKVIEAYLE